MHLRTEHGWKSFHEVFCVCRTCHKSSVLILALRAGGAARDVNLDGIWKMAVSLNSYFEIYGYLSLKDRDAMPPPEGLPVPVEAAFSEATKCVAVGCSNAAAAMFRLALDLATEPLLPPLDAPEPSKKVRRDLGLRLPWLFDSGSLPSDLRELSECVREDGNDGAHRGNVTREDAEDLQDFSYALLERIFSEPARLEAAKQRRQARRAASKA